MRTAVSLAVAATLLVSGGTANAEIDAIRAVADVPIVLGGTFAAPAEVVEDDLAGTVTVISAWNLPPGVQVDGYHRRVNGDEWFSVDIPVELAGGSVAMPADVVCFDGSSFSLRFDSRSLGIPPGANVDAVAEAADGSVILSFDTPVSFAGTIVDSDDVVSFDGNAATLLFDGDGETGNVDAVDLAADGALFLSFQIGGERGGVAFEDEDVLLYRPGTGVWELAVDGSVVHPAWSEANLQALWILPAVPVATATPTPTVTRTPIPMATSVPTSSSTPTLTATSTPTSSSTPTPSSTATVDLTPTPTSVPVCADGIVTPATEACDDGNLIDGDGCDADCRLTAVAETVAAGGTVTTDPSGEGATAAFPLQASVTTPGGGEIQIDNPSISQPGDAYVTLGIPLQITAPAASLGVPLVILFEVDASLLPEDATPERLDVARNGILVADCNGDPGVASPDPCVASRLQEADGDIVIQVLTSVASEWAIVLRGLFRDEQRCVVAVSAAGWKVARAQAKLNHDCLRKAAGGEHPDVQACSAADLKSIVARAKQKVIEIEGRKCAMVPPFGVSLAAVIGPAVQAEEEAVLTDLYGADLEDAVVSKDQPGSRCQATILKKTQKLLNVRSGLFAKCLRDGLHGRSELIIGRIGLERCFVALREDESGKVAKTVKRLADAVTNCGADLAAALPGGCGGAAAPSECLAQRASCRSCRILNEIHASLADCDAFDDGQANGSCPG